MGNQNRKATKAEWLIVRRVIKEAFPDLTPIFGSHGDYGGHRAPRDHTISFRLQDTRHRFRSNAVWLMPPSRSCEREFAANSSSLDVGCSMFDVRHWMSSLTPANVKAMVAEANGKRS